MWPPNQQPQYIILPPMPNTSPAPSSPPIDPVQSIKHQIESLQTMEKVFEELGKSRKKGDGDKKKEVDWKSVSHLMFWTAPIMGSLQLLVYGSMLYGVYSIGKALFR